MFCGSWRGVTSLYFLYLNRRRAAHPLSMSLLASDASPATRRLHQLFVQSGRKVERDFISQLSHMLSTYACPVIQPIDVFAAKCMPFIHFKYRQVATCLMSHILWQLSTANISQRFVDRLRALYDAGTSAWYLQPNRTRSKDLHMLFVLISSCLALCETRHWCCSGRRLRAKAYRRLSALPPHIRLAISRRGTCHNQSMCMHIFCFVRFQVWAIFGTNTSAPRQCIYQVQHGPYNYIGRLEWIRPSRTWGGGIVHRWREHFWGLYTHRQGTVAKRQQRSRYYLMGQELILSTLVILAIMNVPIATASAIEASTITLSQPNANNLG